MPEKPYRNSTHLTTLTFVRFNLVTAAFVLLGLLIWQLQHVLLLGFGAILFAILLRSLSHLIEEHTPVQGGAALTLTLLLILGLIITFLLLLGLQIKNQFANLLETLPMILRSVSERLGIEDLNTRLEQLARRLAETGWMSRVAGLTITVFDAVAGLVLVLVAGAYLAADAKRYRAGALQLVPLRHQEEAGRLFDNTGNALKLWLLGQLIIMLLVGVLTTLGLMLIGLPSALALGFLAGIAEFVPIVGPILSAVPALLIAVSEGGNTVYWVLALYIVIQQLESYAILPLIQGRAVQLPPVLTLFAILAFGMLFGPVGILLSTPIAVAVYVAVKQLFVREALHQDTEVPGEEQEQQEQQE